VTVGGGRGVTEIHKVEDALAEMASLTIKEEGLLELYQLLIVEARTSRTTFDKMVGYLTRHVGTTFLKTDTIPRLNAFCTAMSQKFNGACFPVQELERFHPQEAG
jgi:hypothetical protein